MTGANCPECGADAEQVDQSFDRDLGAPHEVEEVLVCEEGHQVAVVYEVAFTDLEVTT